MNNERKKNLKKYKDLDLKAIREACDLDFAHYTYKKGMCSCCYNPKDLASLYWRNHTIPSEKSAYEAYWWTDSPKEEVNCNEYTYLLFKNADNGSGHVTKEDYVDGYTCVEWGFPMDKLDKVCDMLQEQLGEFYNIKKPTNHSTCIVITPIDYER